MNQQETIQDCLRRVEKMIEVVKDLNRRHEEERRRVEEYNRELCGKLAKPTKP